MALSTPTLWSSLAIHYGSEKPLLGAEVTELWLPRARDCPLSIRVVQQHGPPISAPIALFKAVCRHSPQWQDMEFSVPFNDLSQLQVQGSLPSLEKLVLGSRPRRKIAQLPITAFSDAPRLREVHLILDGDLGVGPHLIVLPWAQLTSFTGTVFALEDCLYVLLWASSLEEGSFHYSGHHRDQDLSPLPPLTRLKSLKLAEHDTHILVEIFRCITVTALKTLNLLSSAILPSTTIPGTLVSFLARSACPLREFSMAVRQASPEQTSRCLSAMPSLQILQLRSCGAGEDLLQTVAYASSPRTPQYP